MIEKFKISLDEGGEYTALLTDLKLIILSKLITIIIMFPEYK